MLTHYPTYNGFAVLPYNKAPEPRFLTHTPQTIGLSNGGSLALSSPDTAVDRLERALRRTERPQASAKDWKELADLLALESTPEGVLAPICLAAMPQVLPHFYSFHHFFSTCNCCKSTHRWTEIYAVRHVKHGRTVVRNMHKVDHLEWNLPIRHHYIKPRTTPHCFECIGCAAIVVQTLPDVPPPVIQTTIAPPSVATKKPQGGSTPTATKTNGGSRKKVTLEDIL